MEFTARLRIFITLVYALTLALIRSIKKATLYKLTGFHEIYRICLADSKTNTYRITDQVDQYLQQSCQLGDIVSRFSDGYCLLLGLSTPEELDSSGSHRDIELSKRVEELSFNYKHLLRLRIDAVRYTLESIMKVKNAPAKLSPREQKRFKIMLENCLARIYYVRQMQCIVKSLARVKYDCQSHRDRILNIWNSLLNCDSDELDQERLTSSSWSKIGFQGRDPGTDTRGMGLLSLVNLEYLATQQKSVAHHLVDNSVCPSRGYPFAIVGINITYLMHKLIIHGYFNHLYYSTYWTQGSTVTDVMKSDPIISINRLYVSLFRKFDKFWANSEMESIMEFPIVMSKFVEHVKTMIHERRFDLT